MNALSMECVEHSDGRSGLKVRIVLGATRTVDVRGALGSGSSGNHRFLRQGLRVPASSAFLGRRLAGMTGGAQWSIVAATRSRL